ncbi:MAG TPA: regulatory protein RecX [Propionibacteriaceae bacterium]|nr:regulatory protein RecX [Propionibacteriaceae bacterium]
MTDRNRIAKNDPIEQAKAWLADQGVDPSTLPLTPPPSLRPTPTVCPEHSPEEPPPSSPGAGSSPDGSAGDDDRELEPEPDAATVAHTIVLNKLTTQARTRLELSKALRKKNVPESVAASVLDRMEDVGLVDDAKFARTWVESRRSRRYLSKAALRRELAVKGVAKDQIDSALDGIDGEDEFAAAYGLAQKKLRSMAALDAEVQYRRLAGALARRGFGPALTLRVLSDLLDGRTDD